MSTYFLFNFSKKPLALKITLTIEKIKSMKYMVMAQVEMAIVVKTVSHFTFIIVRKIIQMRGIVIIPKTEKIPYGLVINNVL